MPREVSQLCYDRELSSESPGKEQVLSMYKKEKEIGSSSIKKRRGAIRPSVTPKTYLFLNAHSLLYCLSMWRRRLYPLPLRIRSFTLTSRNNWLDFEIWISSIEYRSDRSFSFFKASIQAYRWIDVTVTADSFPLPILLFLDLFLGALFLGRLRLQIHYGLIRHFIIDWKAYVNAALLYTRELSSQVQGRIPHASDMKAGIFSPFFSFQSNLREMVNAVPVKKTFPLSHIRYLN